jgi:hypothetical protein
LPSLKGAADDFNAHRERDAARMRRSFVRQLRARPVLNRSRKARSKPERDTDRRYKSVRASRACVCRQGRRFAGFSCGTNDALLEPNAGGEGIAMLRALLKFGSKELVNSARVSPLGYPVLLACAYFFAALFFFCVLPAVLR